MGLPFSVVVSSENSYYMAWQTQLFCFSAITRLGQCPLIIVHETGQPLRNEFHVLRKLGCRVVIAPSFKVASHKRQYAARNEIGSLLWLARLGPLDTDHVLFCEPDMLFISPVEFEGSFSAERYFYMNYREDRVEAVAKKIGLDSAIKDLNERYGIGVPYLLPFSDVQKLAVRWLALIDAFDEIDWIDIMYAFGFAAALEGVSFKINSMLVTNKEDLTPIAGRRIIHYPYGSDIWNKRNYACPPGPIAFPQKKLPMAPEKTVLGELVAQIGEARKFFGYANPLRRALDRIGWRGRSYPAAQIQTLRGTNGSYRGSESMSF